jgi:hypothetical protein
VEVVVASQHSIENQRPLNHVAFLVVPCFVFCPRNKNETKTLLELKQPYPLYELSEPEECHLANTRSQYPGLPGPGQ